MKLLQVISFLKGWFKFWHFLPNFFEYIHDIELIKYETKEKKFIYFKIKCAIAILTVQFVRLLFLANLPLTETQRFALFDIALLLYGPASLNYIQIAFYVQEINFFYLLYCLDYTKRKFWHPIILVKQVFINRDQRFFLSKQVYRNGKHFLAEELVRKYTDYWISFVRYFVAIGIIALLTFILTAIYFTYLLYTSFFNCFLEAFCRLVLITLNILLFNFLIACLAQVNIIPSIIFVSITLIAFIQLKQIKLMLSWSHFDVVTFHRYTFYHTLALQLVLDINRIYGRMLLSFFSIYIACNTFIVITIYRGFYSPIATYLLCNVIAFQMLAFTFLHLLGIMYTYKLHQTMPFLLHWIAQPQSSKRIYRMTTKTRLSISMYIAKFHVDDSQQYGISYGTLNLMTWSTFCKASQIKHSASIYLDHFLSSALFGIFNQYSIGTYCLNSYSSVYKKNYFKCNLQKKYNLYTKV